VMDLKYCFSSFLLQKDGADYRKNNIIIGGGWKRMKSMKCAGRLQILFFNLKYSLVSIGTQSKLDENILRYADYRKNNVIIGGG
jgi:uncharacterized protein related to proFAR isomerase